jgi:hypothetical protein
VKIKNKAARRQWSGPGPCEACGTPCLRHTAHAISRGAGGPDHRFNTLGLGGSPCHCHFASHNGGGVTQESMFHLIGRREGMPPKTVETLVRMVIRTPKEAPHFAIDGECLCGHEKPVNVTPDPDAIGCPICKWEAAKLAAM